MKKKEFEMYNCMREVFTANTVNGEFYDVDMFDRDITRKLFVETDPQNIDEDDYLFFQEALILLVRDDLLLSWFGLDGLCILYTELMDSGESYYVNKVIFNNEED